MLSYYVLPSVLDFLAFIPDKREPATDFGKKHEIEMFWKKYSGMQVVHKVHP